MDHGAEQWYVESFHKASVHRPVSSQEALTIPEVEVAADEEREALKRKYQHGT